MDPDPTAQFNAWLADAIRSEPNDPSAACLATVDENGRPCVRMVLVKGADARGFQFFTNYESNKARELAAHPEAALCFHWKSLQRQVRVQGRVERLSAAESDAYFATRPRGSQIGAWASAQSRPIARRDALEAQFEATEARFDGAPVPRPPHWGGFVLLPRRLELWQGRENRLHDRWLYEPDGAGGWRITSLQP